MLPARREVLAEAGARAGDVDLAVPHQADLRIIQRLEVGTDRRIFVKIDRYGNTSAGTVPLALDEAARGGRVRRKDLVLLSVFGGGLTRGATLPRW